MKKRMKRALSLMLAFAMVFGMVNTSVFADENMNDGVYFTKSIVDYSGQPDRLKLEAFTTGVVTAAEENVPTDIVLVLDQSGSMDNALGNSTVLAVMKDAVEEFVGEIAEMNGNSGNYRVAIVGFASQSGYNDNTEILTLEREVENQNISYVEVEGELDTSKTYYVRGWGSDYSSISYSRSWNSNNYAWRYANGTRVDNIDWITVYEQVVETTYETVQGVPYNTLKADNSGYDFADALINCTDDAIAGDGMIGQAIDLLEGEGATETDLGMELAYDILTEAAEETGYDREQVIVLLTDGVPTSFQNFDNGVANDAVEYAKTLKDDGAHIFSLYLGSPGSQAANFLQAVSSNYPDATSITELGDRAASSYYSAHSESAAIKNVFSQIVSSILSDSQLNESSVITDEISDYFRLPYMSGTEYDLDQIQVYTVDYLGGNDFSDADNWAEAEEPFDTASVELSEDGKTIQVTGFNFAYHCVTETAKSSSGAEDFGRKLVIYIPIIPDGTTDSFGGYLPTNEDAEIIHGQTTVDSAEGCYADVTISYDLEPAERAYHVEGTFLDEPVEFVFSYEENMDAILDEMITGSQGNTSDRGIPDGKNNIGVDMVYRLYDIGTDDRDDAQGSDTGDDVLVATLRVDAGDDVDVTDASLWDWVTDEVTLTIPANEYYAEKVYVLVCTLTNRDDNTDSLTVYDFLDVAVTRGDLAHLVYGTIDEGGAVKVEDRYDPNDPNNDEGTGAIVGGTYTEAVLEGKNSDTMIFTTKEGYEIEFIRVLTSENSPYDTWTTIYHVDQGAVMAEGYEEIVELNDGLQETWQVYAKDVDSGIAFEVSTRPLVFKLDTTADAGARVTDDTTFSYSATEKLDVFFEARPGYYLDYVVVNNVVYTADQANDPELAEEYGLHITGTATSWVQDSDGDWEKQTVITGGTIDLAKIKNYEVEVYSKKQVHQVAYNYYVREYDSQAGLSYSDWENKAHNIVAYVTYGEALPLPDPTTGAENQITLNGEADNYTLGAWYDAHNGEDFFGITDLTAVTMGAADLDYHAYWANNPSVKSAVTVQKNVTGAQTEDETFTFQAMFHEDLVGQATITIPAGSADPVSVQMDIELTDSQFDQFKAGNGAIYLYEVAGEETNYWQYDASLYAVRWNSELGEAIIWLNGEVVLDGTGNLASVVSFTNVMIAESDLMVIEKKLVGSTENVKVGDTLTWEITVVNNGYADGVLTADMIDDEVLYEDADGKFVSFVPAQKAVITTALPLTVEAQDSVTLTASWIVPDAAEGKIIKNIAKINGDEPEESEEVEVEQPDLKVEKRLTKVGGTVIEYDAAGNRITAIPLVDPTDPATPSIALEWTIIVTNEGNGPGKFTLTDALVKTDMENPDDVERKALTVAPAAQGEYYTVPANDTLTLTASYTVTSVDAHHRLVNTVELKEHDDPTDPDDPDKKDESDPVDVAPYTVAYTYTGTLIPAGAAEQLPAATQHELQEQVDVGGIPAVDGYTFYGWDTDDLTDTDYLDDDTFVITGHVVFEGRWEKEYSELMVPEKVLTAVNGRPVTADTVIKAGDVLIWKIEVVNSGTGVGYVTESNLDDQVLYLDGTEWKAFATTAEVLPEGQTEWPAAPGVAVAAGGGKASFIATWTVPYEAEGKTIKNFAKVGDDDEGDDTPEVKVAEPDLKVEKVLTSPASGKEVKPGTEVKWTITVTNEGKGPGKFTMTDVLTGSGVADAKVTIVTDAAADQDGYYTIEAKTGETAPKLTFTATYVVAEADASHILINKVKVTEHDGDEEEDESDPVEVAPYTVTYVDGVDNEVVFADQVNPELKYGVATPDFDTDLNTDGIQAGDPKREGYRFDGWTPAVADKVTGNATYTAQWTKVDPDLQVTDKKLVRVRDADHNLKKSGAPVVVGDYLIWEVTVTNSGNGAGVVTAADFEDIVYYKNGESWVAFGTRATMLPDKANTWPVGGLTVEAGQSIVVLAVWQVPASAEGKTIKNAAKLTGPDDPEESEEIQVSEPKVTIEKTVAKVGDQTITDPANIPTAQVGETVQWTITVNNEGDAPGKFKLVDQLNGTTGTAVITSSHRADANGYYTIPANTTGWTFTATYQVTAADKGTMLENVVIADDGDPGKPDPTDESEEVPVEANLTVEKTVAKINDTPFVRGMFAEVGDIVTWTIVVSNDGKTEGRFKLVDVLTGAGAADAKVTISSSYTADQDGYYTIAGKTGAQPVTMTFTAAYEVVAEDKNAVLKNEVSLDDGDKDPTDDPEDDSYPVPVEPKLTVVKTVKSIVSGGVETAYAAGMIAKEGDTVKWTITVANESDTVGKFKLVDLLNGETGKVTVAGYENTVDSQGFYNIPAKTAAGHTVWEFTASYTVTAEDKGITLTNKVTLDDGDPEDDPDPTDEADPVPVENPDPAKLQVVKTIAAIGGKAVEYNADGTVKTMAKVGDRIYWNITVTNVGEVATNVTINDILTVVNETTGKREVPTVIVDALPLKAGETRTIPNAFHYDVQTGDLTVQNVAVAETDDDDPSNPGTTPEITVEDPKLEATKTVDRTAAKVGETITYTIKVKNTGNVDLVNVTVKENFSGDLNKITVTQSPAGTRFSAADGTFTIPALAEGDEVSIVFTYVPEAAGTVTNAVTVTGKTENDTDPTDDPTDETDPTETEVTEQDKPGIDVEKTVSKTTAEVGDKITYTIKVTNTGNVKLVNVVLDETGFSGNFEKITDITKSADDVTVDLDNDKFLIADMLPGEVVEITFAYKTTEEGTLENTVVVTGQPEGDTDPTDDPTDKDEAPDVKVEEEDDPIIPVGPTPELDKGGDHLSYIIGYPDGTVQPMGTITRAEVATIFFRLLTDESRAYYWSQDNSFADVAYTDWFNNAVSTMAAAGIVNGYPDGTFRPQDPVSRAEFAAIATRFTEEGRDGVSQKYFKQYFKDVNKDDWFAAAVELAYELGWAQGYEGSYRPEDDMTRAEVMTMVNRIMEREVREKDMLDDMIFWPDNRPEDWYYEAVQEATNSHTYERTNKKVPNLDFNYEVWKKLLENPDWAALERSWSDANSQN